MQDTHVKYQSLEQTLEGLRVQVIDSLPYIADYVPGDIHDPEELFYFLKDLVTYKKDPKGRELLQTVQTLMSRGGKGDCDCFTILTLASCIHLGFAPQQVRIVGKKKSGPSHIYSLVYDPHRQKMCAMDLTNPDYCQQRKYKYKQTLDFMILSLEDDNLSSRASRRAKRQGRTTRQVARAASRTARVTGKAQRKATKRARHQARQDKRLMRVKSSSEAAAARQQRRLDKINEPQFSPDEDQAIMPDEQQSPGSTWQAGAATEDTDYELMPDDTQEAGFPEDDQPDYNPYAGMQDYFSAPPESHTAIGKIANLNPLFKMASSLVKGGGKTVSPDEAKSQYSKIVKDHEDLKKNMVLYTVGSGVAGIVAGVLIGRALRK